MDPVAALIADLDLPPGYERAVETVHRPVAAALRRRRVALGRPLVAGLCGSQGSGKSTMAAFLKRLLETGGLTTAVVSLDDLYLTQDQRRALGRTVHPLLATRGVPGTHDPGLGLALIDVLTDPSGAEVSLPRFDKAKDDRAPGAAWPRVRAPVDIVLLEGWCVGAVPQAEDDLAEPVNALERDEDADGTWRAYVNAQLGGDYARLFGRMDVLMLLQAPSFEAVFGWRALQERKLSERLARDGGAGRAMAEDELKRFVMHYQRLTEHILREMPGRADIVMPLDQDHRIAAVRFKP